MGSAAFRLDELTTIAHETREREGQARRDLYNPWAWTRLAVERVVGFPRYVLRHAGFSSEATNSTGARIVTVMWSVISGRPPSARSSWA